ncbi:hypothetical protein D0469_03760 [Peribacillus saganii]|uniref:Uncharacterized protein n=1 Tax=Peribacillus saganii TaxID=2303992 RepID=A0A372LSA7_9BACI|nr:hypothetical protein D0469_03760 [Peribacillus saganii]
MKDLFINDKNAFLEGVEDLLVVSPLPFDILIDIRRSITEELFNEITFKKIIHTALAPFKYEHQCFYCGYSSKSLLSESFIFPFSGWSLKGLLGGE